MTYQNLAIVLRMVVAHTFQDLNKSQYRYAQASKNQEYALGILQGNLDAPASLYQKKKISRTIHKISRTDIDSLRPQLHSALEFNIDASIQAMHARYEKKSNSPASAARQKAFAILESNLLSHSANICDILFEDSGQVSWFDYAIELRFKSATVVADYLPMRAFYSLQCIARRVEGIHSDDITQELVKTYEIAQKLSAAAAPNDEKRKEIYESLADFFERQFHSGDRDKGNIRKAIGYLCQAHERDQENIGTSTPFSHELFRLKGLIGEFNRGNHIFMRRASQSKNHKKRLRKTKRRKFNRGKRNTFRYM